jgi:cobalt/nickel transport system ATP-binding protein
MPEHVNDQTHAMDGSVAPTEQAPDEVVRVSCVKHRYEDGASVALCGLDFVATAGSRVAVLGPNGSGKTTMLFHILGILRPQEGLVRVFGANPATQWDMIRTRIGVVLQNVDEQLLAPTVAEDVGFTPRQLGVAEPEVADRVARTLARLDIVELADRVPHNLSGGEKRKVALAGALVMEPELLVLDEPFEGLDPKSRQESVELIAGLTGQGTTVILTTHDIDAVPEFADYAYVLKHGGEIAMRGTPRELFARADELATSNVRPPVLASLFAELAQLVPDAPAPELSVRAAAASLAAWKRRPST